MVIRVLKPEYKGTTRVVRCKGKISSTFAAFSFLVHSDSNYKRRNILLLPWAQSSLQWQGCMTWSQPTKASALSYSKLLYLIHCFILQFWAPWETGTSPSGSTRSISPWSSGSTCKTRSGDTWLLQWGVPVPDQRWCTPCGLLSPRQRATAQAPSGTCHIQNQSNVTANDIVARQLYSTHELVLSPLQNSQ